MAQCSSFAQNVPNKLISCLFSQKEAGKFCDISMKFGQVELRAHSCVVAAFSPVINNLLSGEVMSLAVGRLTTAEGVIAPTLLLLEDPAFNCLDCAKKVIDFMYVGKILIDDSHLNHIKAVSESLQVSELLKICRKHSDKCVRNKLTIESLESSISETPVSVTDGVDNGSSKSLCVDVENSSLSLQDSPKRSEECEVKSCLGDSAITSSEALMDETEWNGMKCPKCGLVLMSLAMYQLHCGTHLGKTFTTCYVCNYASIRVPDVMKHLLEKSHGEKVCSVCLLEVGSNQSLKEHLQFHDQVQPFFCLTCNTRFQTRTALNSHIVRHTSETPFVCKECGRGFKWKHGLRSHMVTHSKLKSFLCDQCGFSTAHLRSFIDHKAAHSGEKFKCPKPDCQFSSVRRESIKHHLMTHSKQKPYQCEVCGQAFSQAKNLRRHATSHNASADPEKCPLCSYQTNRSDKFKAHFKRYHKDGEKPKGNQRNKRKLSATTSITLNQAVAKPLTEVTPSAHSSLVKDVVSACAAIETVTDKTETVIPVKITAGTKRLENLNYSHSLEEVIQGSKLNGTITRNRAPEVTTHSRLICDPKEMITDCGTRTTLVNNFSVVIASSFPSSGCTSVQNCEPLKSLEVCKSSIETSERGQLTADSLEIRPKGENDENIDTNPTSDQVVILNANEVLSLADAVCMIPEGTYVIMDVQNTVDTAICG